MIELEEILSHTEYKKIGDIYRASCCFHNDGQTPNLTIYPETSSFYCFSCGAFGDFNKLHCKLTGVDYDQWKRDNKELDLKKKEINYKNTLNLVASRLFCQQFKIKPFEQVFETMKQFDKELTREIINHSTMTEIIDKYFKV